MREILAPENRAVLARFCVPTGLLAFDYDGTLAPLVPDPARATMRPVTRALLEELARRRSVAVISGRSQPDIRRRLHGVNVLEVIGNHGVAPRRRTDDLGARVASWAGSLARDLARVSGVEVEDKTFSIAVHYRRARSRDKAREAVAAAARKLPGARMISGKLVVNLLPEESGNKGTALLEAMRDLGCDRAVYVGDDETDEDVFRTASPSTLLSIRVGTGGPSSAAYRLRGQASIDEFLRALLTAPARSATQA